MRAPWLGLLLVSCSEQAEVEPIVFDGVQVEAKVLLSASVEDAPAEKAAIGAYLILRGTLPGDLCPAEGSRLEVRIGPVGAPIEAESSCYVDWKNPQNAIQIGMRELRDAERYGYYWGALLIGLRDRYSLEVRDKKTGRMLVDRLPILVPAPFELSAAPAPPTRGYPAIVFWSPSDQPYTRTILTASDDTRTLPAWTAQLTGDQGFGVVPGDATRTPRLTITLRRTAEILVPMPSVRIQASLQRTLHLELPR